ncbi:MAG: DJ-1/PfpI family protein [Streptosporangiaceae bacterium]
MDQAIRDTDPGDYDALVLPGGVTNPDQLRTVPAAVEFARSRCRPALSARPRRCLETAVAAACRSHDERDSGGIDGHRRHLAGGHRWRDMAGGADARTAGAAPQTIQPWTPAAPGNRARGQATGNSCQTSLAWIPNPWPAPQLSRLPLTLRGRRR